jgi:di/tricarboxylate transporter
MQVKLIIHDPNVFGFRTAFNTSIAYLNYKLADRTTTSLFGKTTKLSEGITV